MKHEVETQWMGKMQFNSLVNGHTLVLDAPERVGGEDNGPIPKPLLLSALTGCTGMDVVALLRKENISLTDFNLKVSGTLSKQAPMVYTDIHLIYEMQGNENDIPAALNAVNNSQEKLCGVSHMLKQILPLSWQVLFNQKEVFNNQN